MRKTTECIVSSVVAGCLLAVSVICLAVSIVFYNKISGQYPVFTNVIVKSQLTQSVDDSVLSVSSILRSKSATLTSTFPTVFSNQSTVKQANITNFEPDQSNFVFPNLNSINVTNATSYNVSNPSVITTLLTITDSFQVPKLSKLNLDTVKVTNAYLTNLTTTSLQVSQNATTTTFQAPISTTVNQNSTLQGHTNSKDVTATNFTTQTATLTGWSNQSVLQLASGLIVQNSPILMTNALINSPSITLQDKNGFNFQNINCMNLNVSQNTVSLSSVIATNATSTTSTVSTLNNAVNVYGTTVTSSDLTATSTVAGNFINSGTLITKSMQTLSLNVPDKIQLSPTTVTIDPASIKIIQSTNSSNFLDLSNGISSAANLSITAGNALTLQPATVNFKQLNFTSLTAQTSTLKTLTIGTLTSSNLTMSDYSNCSSLATANMNVQNQFVSPKYTVGIVNIAVKSVLSDLRPVLTSGALKVCSCKSDNTVNTTSMCFSGGQIIKDVCATLNITSST
ncbi:Hypothetical_protein [Hexamita inflata]|uniref:Hypothetical_protein n=1 Tax=Hexamita inflata TaxID=28002 RepID=A0AA86N727_9EUKA|nr:Hypothetical protein HINF_LOCUS1598 [Hexamita inflata]